MLKNTSIFPSDTLTPVVFDDFLWLDFSPFFFSFFFFFWCIYVLEIDARTMDCNMCNQVHSFKSIDTSCSHLWFSAFFCLAMLVDTTPTVRCSPGNTTTTRPCALQGSRLLTRLDWPRDGDWSWARLADRAALKSWRWVCILISTLYMSRGHLCNGL